MDQQPRISETLFLGLCRKIGTQTEVEIRREVMNMDEIIKRPCQKHNGQAQMLSGSSREGFRFKSSDQDTMIWRTYNKVVCNWCQVAMFLKSSKHNIILMDNSETPPGFVKLQLLKYVRGQEMQEFVVWIGNRRFISSQKFRNHYCHQLANTIVNVREGVSHGPCFNFVFDNIESDISMCFSCQYWPRTALAWIYKCQQKGWPFQSVLIEIISKGCHMMPIGSKTESGVNELEWRISFSQAEQKLVYSMNHTQFLCYGILKIFLKEVLCSDNQGSLICSYFLKTILFWEIQNNPTEIMWCPSNFLSCFWACFKRLCKCVLDSYCPNFFIPENNMFKDKIIGASRHALLSQLFGCYRMKERCLLLSPTLSSILTTALYNPYASCAISFLEGNSLSVVDIDRCIRIETIKTFQLVKLIDESYLFLKMIASLSQLKPSQFQSFKLQHDLADVLVQTAFMVANHSDSNKFRYKLERIIVNMLLLSSRIGPLSYLLYLGIYYYKTGRYNKVLRITRFCQERFSQPFVLIDDVSDRHGYEESVGNFSLGKRMKKAWIDNIHINCQLVYLFDFYEEQRVRRKHGRYLMFISPFVLVHMLRGLSHFKLGYVSPCLESLIDLRQLLLTDDGTTVPLEIRDMSWQLLGVCQRIVGDDDGALQSFLESMRQIPTHRIRRLSEIRIEHILYHVKVKIM
eukprot:XP_019923544.1 PREDICTED: uncharacterized protein LOC109618965 [Crassostrea gigas]